MAYGHSLEGKPVRSAAAAREAMSRLLFLLAAAVSFLLSVSLWFSDHREDGIFVGLWVPSILALATLVLGRGERR